MVSTVNKAMKLWVLIKHYIPDCPYPLIKESSTEINSIVLSWKNSTTNISLIISPFTLTWIYATLDRYSAETSLEFNLSSEFLDSLNRVVHG